MDRTSRMTAVIIDGEEDMVGDEADYWIMLKAMRQRACVNVYFKGQSIWVGGRRQSENGSEVVK